MGFFDRFTKSKQESSSADPKIDASSCPHPGLRQLAEIYDSRRVKYKIQNKDNTWSLVASLKTEHNIDDVALLFECEDIAKNHISITHMFTANIPKDKYEQLLLLINRYNLKYLFLRFSFAGGYMFIHYTLPQVTSNPGVAADEISMVFLQVSDSLFVDIMKLLKS